MVKLNCRILKFNKRSIDGSGKCNVGSTENEGDIVFGVLFEIDPADLPKLHEAEGSGYRCEWLEAMQDSDEHEALIYIPVSDSIDDSLRPYTWYKDLVMAGAEEHGLPSDYIDRIRQVPAIDDPDRERD